MPRPLIARPGQPIPGFQIRRHLDLCDAGERPVSLLFCTECSALLLSKAIRVFKLLLISGHLLGTCLALGPMLMIDLRLLSRVTGYGVVISPPTPFETRVITCALALLLLTGAMLVIQGLHESPNYLIGNPKLQGKILLVGLLCANALVLHFDVFRHLSKLRPVAQWSRFERNTAVVSVGLSNSMWMYCAFLGIARPWNYVVPFWMILLVALGVFVLAAFAVRLTLALAARDEPDGRGDWIDAFKRFINQPASSDPQFAPTEIIVVPQRPATKLKRVA